MNRAEAIYESMMGNLAEPVQGIENAFAAGSRCEQLYEQIYAANNRVCTRLCVEEDEDLELIISNFLALNRKLCMQMYEYGLGWK